MITLTNTESKKKEVFEPITPNTVKMYSCGPTVYDYIHIGNLRAFLLSDILRRTFEFNGFTVTQVMNITDVGQLNPNSVGEEEDKMTKGLKRENKPITLEAMTELADFYTEKFKEHLKLLNILTPTIMPKASENITEDVAFIQKLQEKGFTYKTSDGIYFDTAKDPQYGKLGGISTDDSHARVTQNSEKKNFKDFALWKFNDKLGYPSPWGQGFPGWHIECSAMSEKYLGEHFDIHTGGADLAPIHHNNEIAQSESAHGHPFVNYWLHNAFVNVESTKMSKSLGNFLTVTDLQKFLPNRDLQYCASLYRYYLLLTHYRNPVNFQSEAYINLSDTLDKIHATFRELGSETGTPLSVHIENFKSHINDDLNTPRAVAEIFAVLKDEASNADKKATLLEFDKVLGLGLDSLQAVIIPKTVQKLVHLREEARSKKDWTESDRLRQEIAENGFDVKDTEHGSLLSPNKSTA
jgi:cysteinyl-tRNA synthetase